MNRFRVRAWSTILIAAGILLLATGGMLAAANSEATPDPSAVAQVAFHATEECDQTNEQVPAPEPTVVAALPQQQLESNCLDCHSDQVRLQELAEPEEVVEAPSEGSG